MKPTELRAEKGKPCERDVTMSNEDYTVGQVANSLFQNKPKACGTASLVQLFSTPGTKAQPVYVALPRENKKRKHTEEETATEVKSSSTKREPFKKIKKNKKNLSLAQERVANRECALGDADEEEEKKEAQIKQKLKNRRSSLVTGHHSTSDIETGIKKRAQVNLAAELLKNKRTLFVGNLPVSCTTQMLKTFFKEYGQIESVRFRSLIPAEESLSKRMAAIKRKMHPSMKYVNAYVVFKEECAANSALQRNGTEFTSGFHIRVDLASKSTSHDNKRSVFVGNLPYEIDDAVVRNHFSQCGNIAGVRIVRDRNTGNGKGFGYVLFEKLPQPFHQQPFTLMRGLRHQKDYTLLKTQMMTTDAVHLALKLNNSELKGRKLRVQRCVEREKAQKKSLDKNVKSPAGPKSTKPSSLKNAKVCPSNSFAGEKAIPVKKSKKARSKKSMRKTLRKTK